MMFFLRTILIPFAIAGEKYFVITVFFVFR